MKTLSILFLLAVSAAAQTIYVDQVTVNTTNGLKLSVIPAVGLDRTGDLTLDNSVTTWRDDTRDSFPITNVWIAPNYHGTIQLGSNYYTLRRIKHALALAQPLPIATPELKGEMSVCHCASQFKPLTIDWGSEAVYYYTNTVMDDEANKTNTSQLFVFMKTVTNTNRASNAIFYFKDRLCELGARSDGVVVWRPLTNSPAK